MSAWAAVLLAGAGSYAFRLSMIMVVDRVTLPHWFERASSYVMPAVFAGLVASSLVGVFGSSASGRVAASVPLLAAVAATAALARRRSASSAVLAGMVALWLTQAVLAVAT